MRAPPSTALVSLAAAAAVACTPDAVPFQLEIVLDRDEESNYRCPMQRCTEYPLGCDVALSVRIVDRDDPSQAYVSSCQRIAGGPGRVLCDLSDAELDAAVIPNTYVRIEVAVWPIEETSTDMQGRLVCPFMNTDVMGRPIAPNAPLLGGTAYFRVGSQPLATVTLGCVKPTSDLNACESSAITVSAQVDDFDTFLPVADVFEALLDVSVGEPKFSSGAMQWVLDERDTIDLARNVVGVTRWTATFEPAFVRHACIQVVERGIQSTATLRCWEHRPPAAGQPLRIDGAFLDRQAIDQVISAIGNIPNDGIVIGRVVDYELRPASGVVVTGTAPDGTPAVVRYLSEDMTQVIDGATATSASGAFISTQAAFPTVWIASTGTLREETPVVGGQVQGKVTAVMLQLRDPDILPGGNATPPGGPPR